MTEPIAINGRAALRDAGGGVERVARELAERLPALTPGRYRVVAPPRALAHRAGHAWEQALLPVAARDAELILSPANTAPANGRSVAFVHDVAPFVEPRWFGRAYGAWHRALLRAVARRARLVLTPSDHVRGQLAALLGIPAERLQTIPLGVGDAFGAPTDPAPLLRRLGLDRRPYVLAVGTDSARKNLGLLDAIAPTLASAGLDVVVAGGRRGYLRPGATPPGPPPGAAGPSARVTGSPAPARLRPATAARDIRLRPATAARDLPGPSDIRPATAPRDAPRRLGYVPDRDLPALYAGAAAFAIPSLYEGFGLPCLEAMAAGTPVVASDRGGLPETCAGAALHADPTDPAAFAAACLAAATDERARDRLVAAGRARAAALTWDRTARRVDAALEALLRR